MFKVKEISAEMTYGIRHRVLRPHQTLKDCKYDTDYDEHTFHIGAFYGGRLVSSASFCIEECPGFSIKPQYRLRAMATLEEFRRLGAGRAVVAFAENIIKERNGYFLWCKGRTSAQEYYQRLGFKQYGEVFDYPPIGPHVIMYKKLL